MFCEWKKGWPESQRYVEEAKRRTDLKVGHYKTSAEARMRLPVRAWWNRR